MKIHKPATLQEAAKILAADEEAQCIAGGATLVAMMNSGVVEPSAVVSLSAIDGLDAITRSADGSITIGAATKHKNIAAYDQFSNAQQVVGLAAGQIAHPPIRNMGTIGGSVAVADPAADFPTALTAADAVFNVVSSDGERQISAVDFFAGFLTTALDTGELVHSIELPTGPANAVAVYDKVAKIDGDIAILSVAVVMAATGDRCEYLRVAIGGCGPTPYRSSAAEDMLLQSGFTDDNLSAAIDLWVAASDPMSDVRGSAAYRRKVLPRVIRRAIAEARQLGESI